MTGELSLGGVYLPSLLLLAIAAAVLAAVATRLLDRVGAYRLIVYRPLVDLCVFILILGLLSLATGQVGPVS